MDQYRDFAFIYDELMDDVDYDRWVEYIEEIIKSEGAEVQNILELACEILHLYTTSLWTMSIMIDGLNI